MSHIVMKKAIPQDAPLLAELGAKTFYDTFRPHNTEEDMQQYIAKAYTVDGIEANLEKPAVHYYIAYVDGKPGGYIKLIHDETYEGLTGKSIELEKIYVLQEMLGAHVGKALMEQAIAHAKQNGFDTLFLGVWQENTRAIRFYEKFGFTTFNTRQFILGKEVCDDFLMKKSLV